MSQHVHESWWLAEYVGPPACRSTPVQYYAGHRRNGSWPEVTGDVSRAVRFPTEDAALFTICTCFGIASGMGAVLESRYGFVVREHIFDYTPPGVALPDGGQRDA